MKKTNTTFRLFLLAALLLLSIDGVAQVWEQKGIDIDGEAGGDLSGIAVGSSSDANTIVIGAFYNDGGGAISGHSRVYEWDGSSWVQKGVDIDGEAPDDITGISVAMNGNGNIIIIGAYKNDGNGVDSGSARVYEWNGSAWIQKGGDLDGEVAGDHAGVSVAISDDGDIVAVGAYQNDNTAFAAGSTQIYEWNGSAWVLKGASIDGEAFGDNSGFSVDLSAGGLVIVIGEWANDDGGSDAGQVRVFEWSGSAWVQKGLDINGLLMGDNAGQAVSISTDGNTIAIGEHRSDQAGLDAGRTRVFSWVGGVWSQKGSSILGVAAGNQNGHSVSLSDDGGTLVIGSDKSDFTDIDAGEVKVYEFIAADWILKGNVIYGEALGDWFGIFVDISADGNTIVAGAPRNDGGAADAGDTRVYNYCDGSSGIDTNILWSNWTLTAVETGQTYQWIDCVTGNPVPGETSISFIPSVNGSYAVEIYDGMCTTTSMCLTVEGLGIENKELNLLQLYPNPSNGSYFLKLNQHQEKIELKLISLSGELVSHQAYFNTSMIEFEPTVTTGVYLLQVELSSGVTRNIRLVKN